MTTMVAVAGCGRSCNGHSRLVLGHVRASLGGTAPKQQSAEEAQSEAHGKKPAAEEKVYLEPEYAKSRTTHCEFRELVGLPRETDLTEWLARNTTTFFTKSTRSTARPGSSARGRRAGPWLCAMRSTYCWCEERGKKVKCTAPQHVDLVMSSVQKLVTDEDVFPSSFESLVKICRYLSRVLWQAHWCAARICKTCSTRLVPGTDLFPLTVKLKNDSSQHNNSHLV